MNKLKILINKHEKNTTNLYSHSYSGFNACLEKECETRRDKDKFLYKNTIIFRFN